MTVAEIREILAAPGAPEPTLLPWLALRVDEADLPRVAAAAAAYPWPVVADAVAEVLARRARDQVVVKAARAALDRRRAYPFPFAGADERSVVDEIAAAVATASTTTNRAWLVGAMIARAVPFLSAGGRQVLLHELMAVPLPTRWAAHLAALTGGPRPPWRNALAEIFAAHPAISRLTELAAGDEPELRTLWSDTVDRLVPLTPRGLPEPGPATLEADPVPLPGSDDQPRRPRGHPRPKARSRWVQTGVATPDEQLWPPDRSPRPGTAYLYWLRIGADLVPGGIDDRPARLTVPRTAEPTVLTVALYAFPGEIEITRGADSGHLVLHPDGTVSVPGRPGADRLYLPIRTPPRAGRCRLRCSLYAGSTLLQSRLLEMEVAEDDTARPDAVHSITDYLVDSQLDPAALAELRPLTLSVFMNDNGPGTHGFSFLGEAGAEPVKAGTVLSAGDLQHHVDQARKALRRASWGTDEDWTDGRAPRYQGRREADLDADLIRMAQVGYRMWTDIAGQVAEDVGTEAGEHPLVVLQRRMRPPGTVEFATRDDTNLVVPAALFYDYPLNPNSSPGPTFCPAARAAIDGGAELAVHPCFVGECPHYADRSVVCPGGFWGFRHGIGLPQSARGPHQRAQPAPPAIPGPRPIEYRGRPRCVVGIAEEFRQRQRVHLQSVRGYGDEGSQRLVADPDELLETWRREDATHLVYLYCHGGRSPGGYPSLLVGREGMRGIGAEEVQDGSIWWLERGRPLVFLNACASVEIAPRWAMSFVKAFVRRAGASGVIGTEVTSFEQQGSRFADALLAAVFTPGTSLGQAMRAARLAMLRDGSPLGMVFTAYAAPQLEFRAATS